MTLLRNALISAMLLLPCLTMAGCRQSTEKLKSGTETYPLKGVIVAVDGEKGEITLQHDAVPGFMPAMTMPYKLMYGNITSELHQGDMIRARLQVQKTADGDYRNAQLDEIAVLAQAKPDFRPQSNYHVPAPGDAVPDFHVMNQDGKSIALSSFRGKALLITFIYTRCPLGDFCPKMSKNLAAVEAKLCQTPQLCAGSQMLSLSFDPTFDTPSILRAYGTEYVGNAGFKHWQFAAPAPATLSAVEHFFNLGATGSNASITHSLSTTLVGPDGKVVAWYPGNEWSVDEVAAKMASVVSANTGQPSQKDAPRPL